MGSEQYLIYKKYIDLFEKEGLLDKTDTFRDLYQVFNEYYLSEENKDNKRIIEAFFNRLSNIKNEKNILYNLIRAICSTTNNDTDKFSKSLQFSFFLVEVIQKLFRLNKQNLFNLLKFYVKNSIIIFWSKNNIDNSCTVVILPFSKSISQQKDYLPNELNNFQTNYLKIYKLKQSGDKKDIIEFYDENYTVVKNFDAKFKLPENIEKNIQALFNHFENNIKTKMRYSEDCPWCNPNKKKKGADKKCECCHLAEQLLIELNNEKNGIKKYTNNARLCEAVMRKIKKGKTILQASKEVATNIITFIHAHSREKLTLDDYTLETKAYNKLDEIFEFYDYKKSV